jgi:hypothetical protein
MELLSLRLVVAHLESAWNLGSVSVAVPLVQALVEVPEIDSVAVLVVSLERRTLDL